MDRFWKYKLDHVIFWTATVGFHMFTRSGLVESVGYGHFLLETLVRNGLLAMLIYLNLLVLIPRYAQKQKIASYVILAMAAMVVYTFSKNAYDVYLNGYIIGNPGQRDFFANTYYNFSIAFFYLTFSIALHLSKAWYFQKELIRKMEIEKLNAELDYLKAQINPHFVFNTINTIFFQIDRENSVARRSLSNFSDMLRYQLYECNGTEIPIEREIRYIKSYVAMQQERKDGNYDISFKESGDLSGFTVSPLLLIPFVENAFKHVSHFAGRNEIRIELGESNDTFMFTVFNTKEERKVAGNHSGIGLRNVKRRLELLYRDRHALKIEDRPGTFEVKLALNICKTEVKLVQ